jgi:putative transposase
VARLPRLAGAGRVHLVLQRSRAGEVVLADDFDARRWREALQQAIASHPASLHAYGLWPVGFLMVVSPAAAAGLGALVQALGRRYGAHFNRRHGRRGGLWEGRFRATIIEPAPLLLDAMQWVETAAGSIAWGPSGAGAAPPWSSAPHHRGEARDPLMTDAEAYWALGNTPFEREAAWRRRLETPLPPGVSEALAQAAERGWALGSPAFIAELQQAGARRAAPLPRGRPAHAGGQAAARELAAADSTVPARTPDDGPPPGG